ncbi:hypothetical protein M427DRAFT_30558 [Gonapodya prolifera JEL478]|uniref:OPT superfamily oligopeptide transporter n=1 Tax=Gonapodya prolifera (strain JEL478) TaxID=1344416 RepID=A0A139AKZ3_GONPJ|nr:hypothetical protein M427DRAFT_30558 [Gonapodya prolifera JEL478]|eukprot:KXS17440.1 hypothetical protein M427DRAFT_30558 [Gonapodya prolifera JEL478]
MVEATAEEAKVLDPTVGSDAPFPEEDNEKEAKDEKGGDVLDEDETIITAADVTNRLLSLRDDFDKSITFRSLFLATVLAAFQAAMTMIYYVRTFIVLIAYITASSASNSVASVVVFSAQNLFYDLPLSATTVHVEAVYWGTLPTVKTLQGLRWEQRKNSKPLCWFWYSFVAMFIYQMVSGITSFQTSLLLKLQWHQAAGFVVCYIAMLGIYYGNGWQALSQPFMSTRLQSANGSAYPVATIFVDRAFDEAALARYGIPHQSGSFAYAMFMANAVVYGTVLGGFVMISIVNSSCELLVNSDGDSSWSGATLQSFNTNAASWALAQYLYKAVSMYEMVPLGMVIGAGLVAIHRIITHFVPKIGNVSLDKINLPHFIQYSCYIPYNQSQACVIFSTVISGFFTQFYLRNYRPRLFKDYIVLGHVRTGWSQSYGTFYLVVRGNGCGGSRDSFLVGKQH